MTTQLNVRVRAWYDTDEEGGWYAVVYGDDEGGATYALTDSEKVDFPVDLALYGPSKGGYVRDALAEAFPDAEIEVKT